MLPQLAVPVDDPVCVPALLRGRSGHVFLPGDSDIIRVGYVVVPIEIRAAL
jgi:hypothetical protein